MNALAGTGGLVRLILRRDRYLLPIWVLLLAVLPASYASATQALYPTAEGLRAYYASIAGNPSLVSTIGPAFGPSLGALAVWRTGSLLLFAAVIGALTVIRHTRAEEDAGRRELLGAAVVGRQAPLAAALAVTCAANLAMGAVAALALAGFGLPVPGSLAFGLAFAATGWMFAAAGAVAAQLTEGAGAARGIAVAFVGVTFLLRAAGDAAGPSGGLAFLSWLSPIGWAQRVRPYAGERWWVFGLVVALVAALAAAAWVLQARRDLGAGILPARPGPAEGSPHLRSPLALAWRLHRGPLLGWAVGLAVGGAVVGGASRNVEGFVQGSAQIRELLARLGGTARIQDTYLAATLGIVALAAAAYAVQATLRLRVEESGQRAEAVLATSVGRTRWVASHLAFGALGPAVALAMLGVGTGLTSGSDDVGGQVGRVVVAALAYLPAVWVLAGVAAALFGLLPRLAVAVSWGALAACVLITFVGPLLQLDQRVLDLSPFAHVPRLPGGVLAAAPLLWLTAVAAVLVAAGLVGFRRRDLASGA